MRTTVPATAAVAALIALACASIAYAVSGPDANDNSKFVYSEAIDGASSNLTVTFSEGGQKRFAGVDFALSATAVVTSTCDGQTVAEQLFPTTSVSGLVPDEKGRVAGAAVLQLNRSPGSICPGVQFRVDYTALVLTNVSSGHVYGLDDVSRSSP
jgi:hypothetical protein